MRWDGREESSNVEDRRSQSFGGGRSGMKLPIAVGGKGSLAILAIVVIAGMYGIDLTPLLNGEIPIPTQTTQVSQKSSLSQGEEDKLARLSSRLLRTTETTWEQVFARNGQNYENPKMVLYTGATSTACGTGQSAMGPFYCPGDHKLYLDLSFYKDMQTKLGGGGEFALGYVLAHEVGHHVQTLTGISSEVRKLQSQTSEAGANRLSVKQELQADCLAGVWGYHMQKQGILESGDLETALKTATAIGDDRLQKQSTGRVVPDSFTHGTSEQRLYWFKRGFEKGTPSACNTFKEVK
jgi:hypothetical protein